MTPIKEIGEFVLADGDKEYFFRPSFAAMMRLGDPEEIVAVYVEMHSDSISQIFNVAMDMHAQIPEHQRRVYAVFNRSADASLWAFTHMHFYLHRLMMAAAEVIQACCEDDVSHLTGWMEERKTGRAAMWVPDEPISVVGRKMIWRPGRMPVEHMIVIARNLLAHGVIGKARVRKLQRHEEQETTTAFHGFEYISAARSHFGLSRYDAEQLTMTEFAMLMNDKYPNQKGFTREEYDAVMDDDDRRWAALMAKAQKPA